MLQSIIAILILSSSLAWGDLNDDFEKLKNQGRNLEATGTICEDVAQLRLAEKYPTPKYNVITGVVYADNRNDIGELDLVVFNMETQLVDAIGEVKCWKIPLEGLEKAKDQRARFLKHIRSSKPLKFRWLHDPTQPLTKSQFEHVREFFSIGPVGSVKLGYDDELPYTLKELMTLRNNILRCRSSGACSKP